MLDIRDVAKSFDRDGETTTALASVAFTVPERQFVAIVGPSGCGKTTLLRCIAGLMEASQGTISVEGRAVFGPPAEMVYVFQEYSRSLFPWRRLSGNAILARALRGDDGRQLSSDDHLQP